LKKDLKKRLIGIWQMKTGCKISPMAIIRDITMNNMQNDNLKDCLPATHAYSLAGGLRYVRNDGM
jgi:hypothetical protein